MTSHERIGRILRRSNEDSCGFWIGNPKTETLDLYRAALGLDTREEALTHFGSDCRWINLVGFYRGGDRDRPFDFPGREHRTTHGARGLLADCETVADVERYPWPDADDIDYGAAVAAANACEQAVLGGAWGCFFHDCCDLIGMEEYFIKMHTHPAVVEAVTERILAFYLQANDRYFAQVGEAVAASFFGNDLGTQLDLLISPVAFDTFVLPGIRQLAEQAHAFGKAAMMHSCGSIAKIIPRLIDAGVDALHPLQAQAAGMDAETLARQYRGQVAFVGGVDTQDLLRQGTPAQVQEEVRRLKETLGPHYIVSPSHEALLPDVPLANAEAMALAARGD